MQELCVIHENKDRNHMRETLEQMVARINAGSFIPNELIGTTPIKKEKIMPKTVKLAKGKEFTFSAKGEQSTKYAWDEWFSGELLLIERSIMEPDGVDELGEPKEKVADKGKRDYDVLTDAMPPKIKTAARKRYKVVQVSRKDADGNRLNDSLIIRARDMTAEERVAEDLKRAEEKEALKAAKEEDTAPAVQPQLAVTA